MIKLIFKTAAISFLILGCTTPAYEMKGFDVPVGDIQRVISENIPEGIGFMSNSRREFYSKPISISDNPRTLVVMKILVIGDRRPYDLAFHVRKINGQGNPKDLFDKGEEFKGAQSLAKRTAFKIESSLTKRHNEKNLFDDFRPF